MRAALVTYLVIVIAGLGGTGAYALWSQTGTLSSNVTAATWAPAPVSASTVTCTLVTVGSQADVTLKWAATDATSYTVAAPGASPATATTGTASAVIRVNVPKQGTPDVYSVTITAEAAGAKAASTPVRVEVIRTNNTTVTCR